MKRLLSIIIALALLAVFGSSVSALPTEDYDLPVYSIHEPYEYTILPGTVEWDALNIVERANANLVEKSIAQKMTTEALWGTVLGFPFIINIGLYETSAKGIEVVRSYFEPLDELLKRPDAFSVILDYISNCENNGNANDLNYIVDTKLNVAKSLGEYLFSFSSGNSSQSNGSGYSPRYFIDPITGVASTYVYTPNHSGVWVYIDLSWSDHLTLFGNNISYSNAYSYSLQAESLYSATMLRNPDPSYNCHSYAFYSTNSNNCFWMPNPYAYVNDNSYSLTTMVGSSVGDKILYFADGALTHSGRITSISNGTSGITVTSKWGAAGLFEHLANNCPYVVDYLNNGSSVATYRAVLN